VVGHAGGVSDLVVRLLLHYSDLQLDKPAAAVI
jgi:hypothetical protein